MMTCYEKTKKMFIRGHTARSILTYHDLYMLSIDFKTTLSLAIFYFVLRN